MTHKTKLHRIIVELLSTHIGATSRNFVDKITEITVSQK